MIPLRYSITWLLWLLRMNPNDNAAYLLGIESPQIEQSPIDWPLPSEWIQEHFYLYDTRQPVTLYDSQIRPLNRALERDDQGRYRYDTIVWSWMKKSAKSTIMAAVAHYICTHKPNAVVYFIGNDLRQATSRTGFYLRESIKLGRKVHDPTYKGVKVPVRESGTIHYPNGSRVEMLPIDPEGEAGSNYDMCVFSELWGWRHIGHKNMWAEMTISPNRFGHAQRWVDTYAGYVGESPVLEPLFEYLVEQGRQIYDDLEVYENGRMFGTWITKHHLPWQTPEYYAAQAGEITPKQMERMHGNKWVTGTSPFVEPHQWRNCIGEFPPDIMDKELLMGVDAGWTSDCFGIVVVARRNNICYPVIIKKYEPDSSGLDFKEPLKFIRDIAKRYHLEKLVYDPTQLHHPMGQLNDEGNIWVEKFDQGKPREKADGRLYHMIVGREIVHDGNADLTEHVLNANKNEDTGKNDNVMRITKRSATAKNDLAVALSMAVDTAMRLNIG